MEHKRQAIHLSGLLFVLLAQFTRELTPLVFFLIAFTFLVYSEHVRRERIRLSGLLDRIDKRLRAFASRYERPEAPRPYAGAIWFYAGCGLAFLLFPLGAASAACAILALGDSLSTVVGSRWGRRRLVGKKTAEGSLAFFLGSFAVSLPFVGPAGALAGASAGTIAELLSGAGAVKNSSLRALIDDNWIVPLAAGIVMVLV